jgi:hypothetical protein
MIALRAAVLAVAVAGVAAAPAQAQPSTPLPSALTLTVSKTDAPAAGPRTVLLVCSPTAGGTHPNAAAACGELAAAGGDFDRLHGRPMRFCPMIYDPVTVSAEGVWNGASVSYRHTYPNSCGALNRSQYVFAF